MSNTSSLAAPTRRPARNMHHSAGFWVIAAAFLIVVAYASVPTPLYAIYQARDGFSTFTITIIFAAYAAGVMLSLYLAGHVSDWLGRRRVILAAIVIELLSAVLFLVWPEVPGLLVARFISGIGVGILTATATAHLSELRLAANPGGDMRRAGIVSTLVNIGGIGVGPLLGGILSQWVVAPLVTPFVVFIVLLGLAAIAVAFVPETVERQEERRAYRPQRLGLPEDARGTFSSAAALVFSAFALFGIFTSLAPSFIVGTLHETSRFIAGLVVFAVFGSAAVAQVLTGKLSIKRQLWLAAILMTAGQIGLATSVLVVSLPLFLVAGIVAGAGGGIAFRSAVGVAASLAPPQSRGELLAVIFLIGYAGMAIPVVLVGLAVGVFPATAVLVGFSAIVLVLVDWSSLAMAARKQANDTSSSPGS
ncbi:MFS transporter [Glaciihabitans sp. UYNi722]|uniref:MFS transporter n=1 Tax=Glaciihabitans sp. UYNi722 TaxID=3156344 RepID=UPI003392009C